VAGGVVVLVVAAVGAVGLGFVAAVGGGADEGGGFEAPSLLEGRCLVPFGDGVGRLGGPVDKSLSLLLL
jgi:hypothetical protein